MTYFGSPPGGLPRRFRPAMIEPGRPLQDRLSSRPSCSGISLGGSRGAGCARSRQPRARDDGRTSVGHGRGPQQRIAMVSAFSRERTGASIRARPPTERLHLSAQRCSATRAPRSDIAGCAARSPLPLPAMRSLRAGSATRSKGRSPAPSSPPQATARRPVPRTRNDDARRSCDGRLLTTCPQRAPRCVMGRVSAARPFGSTVRPSLPGAERWLLPPSRPASLDYSGESRSDGRDVSRETPRGICDHPQPLRRVDAPCA